MDIYVFVLYKFHKNENSLVLYNCYWTFWKGFDLTDLKEIVDNLPGSDSYSKLIVAKKAKVLLEKDKVYFAVLKIADLI